MSPKTKLTKGQTAVLSVFNEYGVALPDHALVPLAQHAMKVPQSSSSIRSRRAELYRMKLLRKTGTTKTTSGRTAGVYEAV